MSPVPTAKGTVTLNYKKLLVGGIMFVIGGFSVIGGQNVLNRFDASGNAIKSTFVSDGEFNVFCSGTGGLSTYSLCAIENPISRENQADGTGAILTLYLDIENMPAGGSIDVVVADAINSASGVIITGFDNVTGTGTNHFMSVNLTNWGSGQFIVVKSLTDQTSSFSARLRGTYRDVFGE